MTQDDLTRTILARERARCDALLAGDVSALSELLSDRLVFVHANASRDTKQTLLEKMGEGAITYRALLVDQEAVLAVGDGAALLSARLTADVLVRQVSKRIRNLTLSAWAHEDGAWRLIAYQPTPISD
jgi:hypothetical protein